MIKLISTILFSVISTCLIAQNTKGIIFESGFHYGTVIKHTKKFQPPISGKTFAGEWSYYRNTYGKKDWQEVNHFPMFGVSFSYFNFGNNQDLGSAIAIRPSINYRFLDKRFFYGYFHFSTGLAFLNKPYHHTRNRINNVIGSKFNDITVIRLGTGWRFNPNWALQLAGTFTHYSNGGVTQPNLGINTTTLFASLVYSLNPVRKEDYILRSDNRVFDKKIRFHQMLILGGRERGAPGGKFYPSYGYQFTVTRNLSRVNRLHAGLEFEYATSTLEFLNHIGQFETQGERRRAAFRPSFILADEIILGNFSIMLQLGIYFGQPLDVPWIVYAKLGGRYYLPIWKQSKNKIFVSGQMKSHKSVAEYINIGVGVVF